MEEKIKKILYYLFCVATVLLLLVSGIKWLANRPFFRISNVQIVAADGSRKLAYADKKEIFRAVRPYLTGSFFSVDVGGAKKAAQSVGWVETATVERMLPAGVKILISEHIPQAYWLRDGQIAGLVDQQGRIFQAAYGEKLPQFDGEADDQVRMLERYRQFSAALKPLRLQILRLQYTPSAAWSMMLDNGVEIRLGKNDVDERFKRFVAIWPDLSADAANLDYMDMRYSDGVAVRKRAH